MTRMSCSTCNRTGQAVGLGLKMQVMKREHIALTIFITLTVIAFYLFYSILRPFLASIIWGAVLAGIFYPVNAKLRRSRLKDNLRAVIMCIIVVAVIIVPAVFLAVGLIGEVAGSYQRFKIAAESGQLDFILKPHAYGWNERLKDFLSPYIDTSGLDIESLILVNLQRITGFLLKQVSNFVGNFSLAIASFAFAIFSMFFFLRDGDKLVDRMKELMPMSEDLKEHMSTRLREVIRATIYGGVLVAALEGIVGGFIFWFLGLPSPIFWGTLMGFLCLIPIVGPYLIYVPAAIILILSGAWIKGIVLLALGILVMNVSENLLRPVLISGKTRIPTLVLFFSILGGIRAFGLLGIILGPVLASIVLTLIEIYKPRARKPA